MLKVSENSFWFVKLACECCSAWVKEGDNCTFQTVSDNSTAPSSPRLDLLSAAAPAPATSTIQTSSTNSTASDSPRPEVPSAPAPTPFVVSTPGTSPGFSNRTAPNSPGLNQPLAPAPALVGFSTSVLSTALLDSLLIFCSSSIECRHVMTRGEMQTHLRVA